MKTKEEIDKEIQEVAEEFDSVEAILGYTADGNWRVHLVHREINSFNYFVQMMMFGFKPEQEIDEFDIWFREEYKPNFYLDMNSTSADDIFKYACLYYIYRQKMGDYDGY